MKVKGLRFLKMRARKMIEKSSAKNLDLGKKWEWGLIDKKLKAHQISSKSVPKTIKMPLIS